jgi:hypothetical protein
MNDILKSNDNREEGHIVLPLPPEAKEARQEMEIYARFMRHLRNVPNSRMEIKILSAIQFTADLLNLGDALIAKVLVDLGLRGTRKCFPTGYLEFVDKSLLRSGFDVGGPTKGSLAVKQHWDLIGEDKFAAVRREYPRVEEPMFVE